MILGRVVGELWATRRHAGLDRCKLLVIRPHAWYEPSFEVDNLIAVDPVGAGVGEDVIVCMGEPARRSLLADADRGEGEGPGFQTSAFLPVDAAVLGIVDRVDVVPPAQVAGAFAQDPDGAALQRFAARIAAPLSAPGDPAMGETPASGRGAR